MAVTMEIIKTNGARPVAWRWYRKSGRNAWVDYCVGRCGLDLSLQSNRS